MRPTHRATTLFDEAGELLRGISGLSEGSLELFGKLLDLQGKLLALHRSQSDQVRRLGDRVAVLEERLASCGSCHAGAHPAAGPTSDGT
jgi:hypothetical protein